MNSLNKLELEKRALRVREHTIRMATDGGCFIGAALSCIDIMVYLYSEIAGLSPARIKDPNRDYFLLSKGHVASALYGILAEYGFIEKERLGNHLKVNDSIYWHPNRSIPGIEFHSGSLGHLLSVALGVCVDIKLRQGTNKAYVLLGDGELNEGSVWEAVLVAAARHMDNLFVIIDRNGYQANLPTEKLMPLEPIERKFEAFGWDVRRIDGHNFEELDGAFLGIPFKNGKPHVIIADTVRGKGLPSIERRADKWFVNLSKDEAAALLKELHDSVPIDPISMNT